jgi:2-iminobutanoate/2-iminopropanoate deaminase
MARIAVDPPEGPKPAGPYSISVRIDSLVAVAGRCGYAADGSLPVDLSEEIRLGMEHLGSGLRASGADFADVISIQVYLTEETQLATMNTVVAEFFDPPYPARTTVYVRLRGAVRFEISALAVVGAK